jgi:hypothetical protein
MTTSNYIRDRAVQVGRAGPVGLFQQWIGREYGFVGFMFRAQLMAVGRTLR